MKKNAVVSDHKALNDIDLPKQMKPYVMKNFAKELKRVKWPVQKKHNKKFLQIFVFIIILTGLFALISLGATQIIELIGAE